MVEHEDAVVVRHGLQAVRDRNERHVGQLGLDDALDGRVRLILDQYDDAVPSQEVEVLVDPMSPSEASRDDYFSLSKQVTGSHRNSQSSGSSGIVRAVVSPGPALSSKSSSSTNALKKRQSIGSVSSAKTPGGTERPDILLLQQSLPNQIPERTELSS